MIGEWDSPENFRAENNAIARRLEAATRNFSNEENAQTHSQLEAAEEKSRVRLAEHEAALKSCQQEMKKLREIFAAASATRQTREKKLVELSARRDALERQISEIIARYFSLGENGLNAAKQKAQSVFFQTEARLLETRRKLPHDFERLPERNRRAAAAAEEVAAALERKRREHTALEATLKTLGAEGLYSRETLLIERHEMKLREAETARTRGLAARLAHDLIEHRKLAATRSVLEPLEARLSAAFAEITGDFGRRVFLDENLQITGTGRTRADAVSFQNLSQGAKEQLLLCLRLAVAEELAQSDGGQIVILDDVLVNTDSGRQQRVLDLLQNAANKLQLLILTCHAERYRGIGRELAFEKMR